MIGVDEMMPLLVDACPSYAEAWCRHQLDDTFDEALPYEHLGDLSRHLVDLLECGDLRELASVSSAIERLFVEGSDFVREAATMGLLESLQNAGANRRVSLEPLVGVLGTESQRWWRSLNAFWDGRIPYVGADLAGRRG